MDQGTTDTFSLSTDRGPADYRAPLHASIGPHGDCHAILLVRPDFTVRFSVHGECATSRDDDQVVDCPLQAAKLQRRKPPASTQSYFAKILVVNDAGLQQLDRAGYLSASRPEKKASFEDLQELLGKDLRAHYWNSSIVVITSPG
ncbi:hypothetical protein [Actinoplanes nipponensis]|uniref:hypothetical protein n=1 Tax=Actinoplanes nipponensis TaxID=135950 RepID=UPI0019417187|nr:hypothetical protein [Actinoplanes nipponensis]